MEIKEKKPIIYTAFSKHYFYANISLRKLNTRKIRLIKTNRELAEWSKAHDWKSCER